jgi:hypothetical protein
MSESEYFGDELELGARARHDLRTFLTRVPEFSDPGVKGTVALVEDGLRPYRIPSRSGEEWTFLMAIKAIGEPRIAREAALRLREAIDQRERNDRIYGVFMAPHVSPKAGQICKDYGIGYADLSGNAYLSFGDVHIEIEGKESWFPERRRLRTLYSPKAERVLRQMLFDPLRRWKVKELCEAAAVSIGLVSNVKRLLEDREWLDSDDHGFFVSKPEELLKEWRENYNPDRSKLYRYYSIKFTDPVAFGVALGDREIKYAFTGMTGAGLLAPMVPSEIICAYVADSPTRIAAELGITQVDSGGNIHLIEPYDFRGLQAPAGAQGEDCPSDSSSPRP